jgi:hypothetical protein
VLREFLFAYHKLESIRYMAPEQLSWNQTNIVSTEGDVYSLAMTSFEVCFSIVNCPTIQCNNPITIRSSRGYYHTVTIIGARWSLILETVNDHPVQRTRARTNGCRTAFGIRSRLAGMMNPNSGINFLLCTVCFQGTVCRMP